jgi:hypothetical protein
MGELSIGKEVTVQQDINIGFSVDALPDELKADIEKRARDKAVEMFNANPDTYIKRGIPNVDAIGLVEICTYLDVILTEDGENSIKFVYAAIDDKTKDLPNNGSLELDISIPLDNSLFSQLKGIIMGELERIYF